MTTTTQDVTESVDPAQRRRSLSERRQQVTREAIMEATTQAVHEVGIDCSMQDIADRAGLTHRTIYRHFPNREALFDAVSRRHDERLEAMGAPEPHTVEELPEAIERLFNAFDREPDLVRAAALRALTRNEQTASRGERTSRQRRNVDEAFPHLLPEERASAFAVIRMLGGSIGWHILATEFGLSGAQSGPVVRRALEVLIADLRQRDRDAAAALQRDDEREMADSDTGAAERMDSPAEQRLSERA